MNYPAALHRAVGRFGWFVLAAGIGAAIPSASRAATSTTSFNVTATVLASCVVQATDLDFGSYSPGDNTADDASSTIQVTCNPGLAFSIALDAGQTVGATVTTRTMTHNTTDTLPYGLFTTTARNVVWGDGSLSSSMVSDVGTGSQQTYTVYGEIAAGQYAPPGSYSDTIDVTVTY